MHILRFEKNCMFSTQIYIKKSARSLRSLAILSTFSPLSNASSFNKAIYHGGPLDPTRMRRIACFRHTHTIGLLAIIAFSRVSGRYVKHFSDAKVHKFWLARYHFSQVSCVLVSIINKTISRVLRTQSCTYCTDKQ